ncbi:MAG: hypothetical protein ACFFAH_03895 [Promethearchaeota archaeon]
MSELFLQNKLKIQILSNKSEIMTYLQLGINIPILPDFYKYILFDLDYFQAKSILLKQKGNVVGHCLIFNDNNILYFGFFQILNHNKEKISFLINEIKKYAKIHNYKSIRGPINIPTIIFGSGFMEKGSMEDLFITKPVNPSIYLELFKKNGFYEKSKKITWMGSPIPIINPWKIKKYDFSDYEYFNPKDIFDFMNYKSDFLKILAENLPPSSQITPNVGGLIDNYAEFTFKFGFNFMVFFVKYIPTGKIVACGSYLVNPFRKNYKGNFDSCIIYTWAVDSEHRRKGLAMLMYGATSLHLRKNKFKYISGQIDFENIANTEVAKKLTGIKSRTHIILECDI